MVIWLQVHDEWHHSTVHPLCLESMHFDQEIWDIKGPITAEVNPFLRQAPTSWSGCPEGSKYFCPHPRELGCSQATSSPLIFIQPLINIPAPLWMSLKTLVGTLIRVCPTDSLSCHWTLIQITPGIRHYLLCCFFFFKKQALVFLKNCTNTQEREKGRQHDNHGSYTVTIALIATRGQHCKTNGNSNTKQNGSENPSLL